MKLNLRINLWMVALCLTGSVAAQTVCVSTPRTALVLSAPEGHSLRCLYYLGRIIT